MLLELFLLIQINLQCVRKLGKASIFCIGGTDSEEEEFKAKGIDMKENDGLVASRIKNEIVKSEIKDMNDVKVIDYVSAALMKLYKARKAARA